MTDPRQLDGVVYVRARDVGQVWPGQIVSVTLDAYPGQTFFGAVTSIRERAEYTPRNVQTQRDRLNLVFAVRIRVDNRDNLLKAGLPIEATFLTTESGARP